MIMMKFPTVMLITVLMFLISPNFAMASLNEQPMSIEMIKNFLEDVYQLNINEYTVLWNQEIGEYIFSSKDNSTVLSVGIYSMVDDRVYYLAFDIFKGVPRLKNGKPLIIHNLDELASFAPALIRRYEDFIGHHDEYYEKVAKAAQKLHGEFGKEVVVTYEDVYVRVEADEYHVSLYSGYVLMGDKLSINLFGFGFPLPKYLPNDGRIVVGYAFGDKTSVVQVKRVDNPYPKDKAIEKARDIMYEAFEQNRFSREEVDSSIDHIYADIEFLSSGNTIVPVWHIVFYFTRELGGANAYSVTLDASNGNLIGAEPLNGSMGNNNDISSRITIPIFLPWIIPAIYLMKKKYF